MGPWAMGHGPWAHGPCLAQGPWAMGHGPWSVMVLPLAKDLAHGLGPWSRPVVPGPLCPAHGARPMGLIPWPMHGLDTFGPGPLCPPHCARPIVPGPLGPAHWTHWDSLELSGTHWFTYPTREDGKAVAQKRKRERQPDDVWDAFPPSIGSARTHARHEMISRLRGGLPMHALNDAIYIYILSIYIYMCLCIFVCLCNFLVSLRNICHLAIWS